MKPLPESLDALRAGGKAALARCLSALETAPDDPALVGLLDAAFERPCGTVLGLTGPPGVGKSTLTNGLIAALRRRGQTVGVIAVDPSSRRSGGALLGDRTRIESDAEDAGVFVRSMAARHRLGGVAELTFPASVLMRALHDWVIVETVGVGQSESEIADFADLVVFCAQPGSGDALQFMKAGIMEMPDIVLVTKGDMGAVARRAAADVKGALSLAVGDGRPAEVAIVSAQTGAGIENALDSIAARAAAARCNDLADLRQAQAVAWAGSRLTDSFGRVGHAALAARVSRLRTPFGVVSKLLRDGQPLVHEALKNI